MFAHMKIINSHYIPLPEPHWLIIDPKASIYVQIGTLTVVEEAPKAKGKYGIVTHSHPVVTFADGELAWTSFQKTAKCFDFPYFGTNGVDEYKFHPTQKPVALYAWILKNYAKDGDRIFDPMMGSQSSRIAAYGLGFDYVGCELDKEYFDTGCERFNKECKGEIVMADGSIVKQTMLF